MTTLPLIQNNTCHCVWSRQSAEPTVLEAEFLYPGTPYGGTSAASAPASSLISACSCLSGKAVAFRAWKNPSFARTWSHCQSREQQSTSAIPAFARGSLDWWLNNTQNNIHDLASHDCNSYGWKLRGAATLLQTHPWESSFTVLSCSASPKSCCWTSRNHLISSLLI